jgi:hypothetical protein
MAVAEFLFQVFESMGDAWLEFTNLILDMAIGMCIQCTKSSIPVRPTLFSSFYFKSIGLPVSANYGQHQAPKKKKLKIKGRKEGWS